MARVNNKRIMKNTIALYFRAIITLLVSLYTSRVVLQQLGEVDFGIYSVVGTIVVFSSFFQYSIANAIQRFINVELSKNAIEQIKKILNTSITIQFLLCLAIIVIAELFQLFFFDTIINIPDDRLKVAYVVFQLSTLSCCIKILRAPYNAMIVAYEKFTFYAYIGIVEVLFKLLVVFLLIISPVDKLICYSILNVAVDTIITIVYWRYSSQKVANVKYKFVSDKDMFYSIFRFAGWNLFQHGADTISTQGTLVVLNHFIGVIANAAAGIANQIKSAVYIFVSNFQTAFKPQLIQSYAAHQFDDFQTLLYNASRYSFIMLYALTVPIIMNISCILEIWLGTVPQYTDKFVIWTLLCLYFEALNQPLWYSIQADGRLRNYQLYSSMLLVLILPIAYTLLYIGYHPYYVFIGKFVLDFIVYIVKLIISTKILNVSILDYYHNVIRKVAILIIITIPFVVISCLLWDGWLRLIIGSIIFEMFLLTSAYFVFCTQEERVKIRIYLKNKLCHENH